MLTRSQDEKIHRLKPEVQLPMFLSTVLMA